MKQKPGSGDMGDDVYAHLIAAHEDLTEDESADLNARLILLLSNEISDPNTVIRLIDEAAKSGAP